MLLPTLFATLLLAGQSSLAGAGEQSVIEERDLARALFEASRKSVKDLVRQRGEAADILVMYRRGEVLSGRKHPSVILDAIDKREKALKPPTRSGQVAEQLRTLWEARYAKYRFIRSRFESGTADLGTLSDSLAELLEIEIQMALRRDEAKKK